MSRMRHVCVSHWKCLVLREYYRAVYHCTTYIIVCISFRKSLTMSHIVCMLSYRIPLCKLYHSCSVASVIDNINTLTMSHIMYIYIYIYVCMYARRIYCISICIRTYVCMYIYTHIHMRTSLSVSLLATHARSLNLQFFDLLRTVVGEHLQRLNLNMYTWVYEYLSVYICMYLNQYMPLASISSASIWKCMHGYMNIHLFMYVCMYVCMYVSM